MVRRNPHASQLKRGFLLGMLYAEGKVLTTMRIQREMRVSQATAKRDLRAIASLVPVTESKPIAGMKKHAQRRTIKRAESSSATERRP